jgi:hypothetical protein
MANPSRGSAASEVLGAILKEISVPLPVLEEARARRNRVLEIAASSPVVRARFSSGSVAYGTANSPLEDADGGVRIDRRLPDMREFGPDAPGGGLEAGPLMEYFGDYVLQRLWAGDYPKATADLSGKRAVRFDFHTPVDFDELEGPVDPYVHFIVGLVRVGARGLWIPNREVPLGWDVADPEHHLEVMNRHNRRDLRVRRAHVIRLTKRAIKYDETPIMCSWNVSALAVEIVTDVESTLPDALADFLTTASRDIARRLTPDPSPVVDRIELPDNITHDLAATRLSQMARHAREAAVATDAATVRRAYSRLYGPELDAIRTRDAQTLARAAATGATLSATPSIFDRPTRSYAR